MKPYNRAAKLPTLLALAVLAIVLALGLVQSTRSVQAVTTWNTGDVFAGVGDARYNVYDNNGLFKETIVQIGQPGGFTTGCAFNPDETKLYTTNWSNGFVVVFDSAPPLHAVVQTIDTRDFPESVVFAANGHFFVGGPFNPSLEEYDATGTLVDTDTVAADGTGGPDWIDLAADQATMFYASEGRIIHRFDVQTDTQLSPFATLPGTGNAFALRLLAPGDGSGGLLVADRGDVKRLDGAGNVAQTYDALLEDNWFSLNLDPNGTSFWAGDFGTSNFYRFNIATGAVEVGPIPSGGQELFGLCLKGEITAAEPQITLAPESAENTVGTPHTVTATVTVGGEPQAGVTVTFTVTGSGGSMPTPPSGACVTGPTGQCTFTYTSPTAGADTIRACFTHSGAEHCATATKTWVAGPPPPPDDEEDDDDFDEDGERDDGDEDDDGDGERDGEDEDDDNDGERDGEDEDDDNDGVDDEFDSESTRESQQSSTGSVAGGRHTDYAMGAGAGTLLLIGLVEAPTAALLTVEIYDPNGGLVASSPPTPGRALATTAAVLAGSYTVRVRNTGSAPINYSLTLIRRVSW